MHETEKSFGLKRTLGLIDVVSINVGQTIGAGVFALTAIAAGMCGPSLPIAFAIAAVPVAFLMLTLAQLGAALPTVGGTYRYPSRLVSPFAAFVGVWGFALGMLFGLFPLMGVTCAKYIHALWPTVNVPMVAIAVLTVFYITNLFGLEIAATAQIVMVAALIVALLSFGVGGLPKVHGEYFHPLLPHGVGGLLAASALLTYAHLGANAVIELGGEIKNPGRNLPLSLFISIPLVTMIYVIVGYVTVGVVPYETVKSSGDLTETARAFMGKSWFVFFVIGGAVSAIATTINSSYMWATKSMMVLASDGLFPRVIAKIHPRYKTPWAYLTILWAASVFVVLAGFPIETFGAFASIGGLIIFIPVMVAAMLLKYRRPDAYDKSPFKLKGALYWIAPTLGILLTILTIGMLLFDSLKRNPFEMIFFAVWLVLGVFAYGALKKRALKDGLDVVARAASDTFE